jgi:hypothetical protein
MRVAVTDELARLGALLRSDRGRMPAGVSDPKREPPAVAPRLVRPEPRSKNARDEAFGGARPSTPSRGEKRVMVAGALLGLAAVLGAALWARWGWTPQEVGEGLGPAAPSASSSGAAPARCTPVAAGKSFVVGPTSAARATAEPSSMPGASGPPGIGGGDSADRAEPERDELLEPFAVVLGRATSAPNGWAVGVLSDAEGGSVASVVSTSADAEGGTVTKLARSRGDFDPPVVAPGPDGALLVALLEANAGARAVRLASVVRGEVRWGAEIPEGRDESLAIDLAVAASRGAVVWDASRDEASHVAVATFPSNDVGKVTSSRRASPEGIDADAPRIVPRSGGFFLTYVVHGVEVSRERSAERDERAAATPKRKRDSDEKSTRKPRIQGEAREEGEVDEARGGEAVRSTWIEVVLLDEQGAQTAEPMRIGSRDGHVVSYDVAPSASGELLVAWRDEDAPTGGAGGAVMLARVTGSGPTEPVLVTSEASADGAPTLLSGWLAIPALRGPDLLAKLGADGALLEPIAIEPSLGRAEPVASIAERLLLAEPEGKAMRLRVATCGERAPSAPVPSASAESDELD